MINQYLESKRHLSNVFQLPPAVVAVAKKMSAGSGRIKQQKTAQIKGGEGWDSDSSSSKAAWKNHQIPDPLFLVGKRYWQQIHLAVGRCDAYKIIILVTWIWTISPFACTKKSETHIHFGTSISTSTKSTHPKQKSEKTQPIHIFQLVFF